MCLIIVGLKKNITEDWCKKGWAANKDGAGIAISGAIPRVYKGLMTLDSFFKVFNNINDNSYIAVHFRMGTHGKVTSKNTHPFKIDDITYLMHNGVINGLGSYGERGFSDSAHLAKILSQLRKFDRNALLNTLNGRFALISKTISLYGDWQRYNNCYHSNHCVIPFSTKGLGFRQSDLPYKEYGTHTLNRDWLSRYNDTPNYYATESGIKEVDTKVEIEKPVSSSLKYSAEELAELEIEAKELGYTSVTQYINDEEYLKDNYDNLNDFCISQATKDTNNK